MQQRPGSARTRYVAIAFLSGLLVGVFANKVFSSPNDKDGPLLAGTPAGFSEGGGSTSTVVEATPPAEAAAQPPGHLRMLAVLEKIRVDNLDISPFLGTTIIDRLAGRLDRLQDDRSDPRGSRLRFRLGTELLRVGRTEEAIGALSEALARAEAFEGALSREEQAEAVFQLGVAHMRDAEDKNCCLSNNADSCILPIRGGGLHRNGEGSTSAIRAFQKAIDLAQEGSDLAIKARWLLNIAHMTLGSYPDGVPEELRIDPEVFASDEDFPRFVDVAPKVGLGEQDLAGGLVVEDLDGDGDLDVLTSTWDTGGPMHFYGNDGAGHFVDRSDEAGLEGLYGGLNMAAADWDNDGDVDVLVLRGAWQRELGHHPKSLLRNDGHGVFTDVTFDLGLGASTFPTQAAAFADYDNDGDLDLYIGNESQGEKDPCPGELYRNDGKRGFVNVAAEAGVTNDRFAKGVAWGDIDGDRYPDLFVSNMGERSRLYHNERDGTFREVTEEAGVGLPISAFACWFFDYDNDGALDLWVASYGKAHEPPDLAEVARSYMGIPTDAELMKLYKGDGHGHFTDVAVEMGLDVHTLPMGVNFGDLDNDGWLDMYLGTGYPAYEGLVPNVMYRNQAGKGFADVTTAGGFGNLQKGHGGAFADVDDDGDEDVLMKMGGAYPGDSYRCTLFENPGFGNHWLEVRLVGQRSNRFGVGAKIRVDVQDGDEQRSIHRTLGTGGSFGVNPHRQRIGIGSATKVERLEVFWPTTGEHQVLEGLEVDRAIEIVEGEEGFTVRPLRPFELGG